MKTRFSKPRYRRNHFFFSYQKITKKKNRKNKKNSIQFNFETKKCRNSNYSSEHPSHWLYDQVITKKKTKKNFKANVRVDMDYRAAKLCH